MDLHELATNAAQLDAAIRRPETLVETEEEVLARDRARQLYRQSNYGQRWIDPYEAGWKAAKAYYGVQG
jgi:hypothetical protein